MNSPTNHQEQLVMSDHTTVDTEPEQLQCRVRRAISDPGSILPRQKIPHLDDEAESITSWGTRAVMTVIQELQAQRDAAVALLQKTAGGPAWPTDDDDVLAGLIDELDQLDYQTRGGDAQGGEAPPENDRDGGQPSNVAPEPDRGTTTPANTLRPDHALELEDLRDLRLTVARLLAVSHYDDGLTTERITHTVSEFVAMAGLHAEAVSQRDELRAGVASVLQRIEHLPCLNIRCPEGPCSVCDAKKELRTLLADVPAARDVLSTAQRGFALRQLNIPDSFGDVVIVGDDFGVETGVCKCDPADLGEHSPQCGVERLAPISEVGKLLAVLGWSPPPSPDELPARDVEVDADGPWYVRILDEDVHHTTKGAPVNIDWTRDGTMIGVEILATGSLRETECEEPHHEVESS